MNQCLCSILGAKSQKENIILCVMFMDENELLLVKGFYGVSISLAVPRLSGEDSS